MNNEETWINVKDRLPVKQGYYPVKVTENNKRYQGYAYFFINKGAAGTVIGRGFETVFASVDEWQDVEPLDKLPDSPAIELKD